MALWALHSSKYMCAISVSLFRVNIWANQNVNVIRMSINIFAKIFLWIFCLAFASALLPITTIDDTCVCVDIDVSQKILHTNRRINTYLILFHCWHAMNEWTAFFFSFFRCWHSLWGFVSGFVAQNSGVDFVCYQIGFVDVVISTAGTPVLFIILSTCAVALAVVRERK